MIALLLALALQTAPTPPAPVATPPPADAASSAPPKTITAESGPVKAQATCVPERDSEVFCSVRSLEVARGGHAPFRKAFPEGSPFLAAETEFQKPLQIADLDGSGNPQVLLNLYSGGAHCCNSTELTYWVAEPPHEATLHHDWGDPGFRIEDLDHDGHLELVSRDVAFAYAFTSYAASRLPPQIWRFAKGRLEDVTRSFPGYVEKDAKECWKAFEELSPKDPTGDQVRGLAAAFVADAYLLDRGSEGWRKVLEAYQKPDRKKFFASLTALLEKAGYAKRD